MSTKLPSPIGISIPITLGKQGYFQQTFDSVAQSKASLTNLLNTRIGERPMNPTFGTKIYNLIFEQEIDESIIQAIIEEEVAYWIPSLTVQNVEISTTTQDVDNYTVNIQVDFISNNTAGSVIITATP